MKWHTCNVLILTLLIGLLPGCKNVSTLFSDKSPREGYAQSLDQSPLKKSVIVREWTKASYEVLRRPLALEIPIEIKGVFKKYSIEAVAYKLSIRKGATIQISLQWKTLDASQLFFEIYEAENLEKALLSTSDADSLTKFEADRDTDIILLLQPELFGEGVFALSLKSMATYSYFPVSGKDSRNIQSFWGASRGGGSRKHEGIDIFAERGTAVLAPTRGIVGAVKEGGLGGKQVWLRDTHRRYNLYFAHLDSQAVTVAQQLNAGDTLGFVGNTGNAKYTSPHLHFGAYSNGAFDPLPLVATDHALPEPTKAAPKMRLLTVKGEMANMRKGPGIQYEIVKRLPHHSVVLAQTSMQDWTQIETPDGLQGAIYSALLNEPEYRELPDTLLEVATQVEKGAWFPVRLSEFRSIGTCESDEVIADGEGNLYFLPRKRGSK